MPKPKAQSPKPFIMFQTQMHRRFLVVTVCLVATIAFLVGLIVAGSMMPAPAQSAPEPTRVAKRGPSASTSGPLPGSFADIAERLNPAVVNIDATTRAVSRSRRRLDLQLPDSPDGFNRQTPERERDGPRRGAGTGFIIDQAGYILTNPRHRNRRPDHCEARRWPEPARRARGF